MAKHVYLRHRFNTEVPFFDVDAMQIVWHGNYVKYLEMARCDFLSKIHYDYNVMGEHGFSWPVVQMNLKYVKPARFGQKISVDVTLVEYETCLRLNYIISDTASGEKLTQASTTQVALAIENGEMQFQTPASWQQAVQQAEGFCEAV